MNLDPDVHSPSANGITDADVMAAAEYSIGNALREAMRLWQTQGPPTPEEYLRHMLFAFGTGFGYGFRRAHVDLTLGSVDDK